MLRRQLGILLFTFIVVFSFLGGGSYAAGSGFLDVTNSTQKPVSIIAIAPDETQEVLYKLQPGEVYSLPVEAGTQLGFSSGSKWVGDGYVVSGDEGEAVTVPYADQSQASAPEAGGNAISFTNTTQDPISVIAVKEDKSQEKLLEVAAGATESVNLPTGQLIGFAQNKQWLGDAYEVTEALEQSVELPYTAPQDQADEAGGITIGNTSEAAVTVVAIDKNSQQKPLFNIPPGKTASYPIPAGTLLGFAQGKGWLGDGYTVTGAEKESVNVPYIAEASSDAAQDDSAQASADDGNQQDATPDATQETAGQPLAITNASKAPVDVMVVAEDGTQSRLAKLKPGETVTKQVVAGLRLGFSQVDRKTKKLAWLGDAFIVTPEASSVSIPYTTPESVADNGDGTAASADGGAAAVADLLKDGADVKFSNTGANAIIVAMIGDDKKPKALYEIPAGATEVKKALSGSTLVFYDKESKSITGDAYKVADIDNIVALPYSISNAFLERQKSAAPNIAGVPLMNFSPSAVTVYAKEGDKPLVRLFELPPGELKVPVLALGVELLFYQKPAEDAAADAKPTAVGQPFTVAKTKDIIPIPYYQPSELAKKWQAQGGTKISLTNIFTGVNPAGYRPEPVLVMAHDGDDAAENADANADPEKKPKLQIIGAVYPNANFEQSVVAPEKSVLNFVLLPKPGEEPSFYGTQYLVGDKPETLNLPFATPLEDQLVAKIDLNKLAADIAKSLVESNLENSGPKACWKNTKTRGVGTVPRNCPPGQSEDTAGLCYDDCQPGYYSNKLTMCIPECPAGYRDDGLYCFKPAPITRDAYPWEFGDGLSMDDAMDRCRHDHGSNCVTANSNTMVYSTCPANYEQAPVITNLCTPTCPPGMTDIGISCQKNTYDRGVGHLMQCDGGMERDAGLCYTPCGEGYDSVGPVCWHQCPKSLPVNCGASCAKTEGDCAQSITDQVTSPIITAGNIALIAVTAGAAAGATAGAEAAATGAEVGAEVATEVAAKEAAQVAAKQSLTAAVRSSLENGALAAFKAGGKAVIVDQLKQAAIGAVITGAVSGGISIATKNKLEDALKTKVGDALSKHFTDAEIDAVVQTAIEASGSGKVDFPLESLDPTGIAQIVVAYNLPMCSDVK
jgi:hypothetical protein